MYFRNLIFSIYLQGGENFPTGGKRSPRALKRGMTAVKFRDRRYSDVSVGVKVRIKEGSIFAFTLKKQGILFY